MNFDEIENLNEEEIFDFYNEIIEKNYIVDGLYVICKNGKTGYWGSGSYPSEYIRYCGPDCNYRRYSACATNCVTAQSVCGSYSEIGVEMSGTPSLFVKCDNGKTGFWYYFPGGWARGYTHYCVRNSNCVTMNVVCGSYSESGTEMSPELLFYN